MRNFPKPIWNTLTEQKRTEIQNEAMISSPREASIKYHEEIGMKQISLEKKLIMLLKPKTPKDYIKSKKTNQEKEIDPKYAARGGRKHWRWMELEPEKLSREEKQLIEKLKTGGASLEEVSRVVAVKVFEKMLKYPFLLSYTDWIKTELLKVKKEESHLKESWAKGLLVSILRGKLPPTKCPSCGYNLTQDYTVEGEIIADEIPKLTGV